MHLATGMGVEAIRVEKADDIASVVAKAVATNRPYLVELAIEGKTLTVAAAAFRLSCAQR